MAISEVQLITWSHQGAIQSSALTYDSIKTCIGNINWNKDISYDIYLQGSYKNSTNIRGNSDVDIAVEFTSVFYSNKHQLPQDQLKEFNEYHNQGKYELQQFKKAVYDSLVENYDQYNVNEGNKSIKVKGSGGRLDADIICCAEYREYKNFSKTSPFNYIQGITFWQKNDGIQIRNFPKQHFDNGVAKNQSSGTKYRSATRIIKNIKTRLVELNRISNTLAPSYYLESLLYNVPSRYFNQTYYQDIIRFVLDYLGTQATAGNLSNFMSQNECRNLFNGIDPHWNEEDCKAFLKQIIGFYNER